MSTIADRWAEKELGANAAGPHDSLTKTKWRHYRPFVDAVKSYVDEARDGERVFFGIEEFDAQIRGVGRGQLCVCNGFSHSGKTLWLAHVLRHNKHKRIAYFTPDEPAQLVLAKLASASSGVPADEIEDRIVSGDEAAVEILRRTATIEFPNLAVFDKPLRGEDMDVALREAEQVWSAAASMPLTAELVVFDYLELLQAGETVPQKFEFIKAFGSKHNLPVILVHQTSRTAGKDGLAQNISSGAYGGEQFATFQLGVWRKKAALAAALVEVRDKIARAANGATDQMIERQEDLIHELARAEYTLTVAITKNKRPGRREGREEIDFELFGATGLIAPLAEGDLPQQYRQRLAASRQSQPAAHQTESDYSFDSDVDVQQTISDDEFYQEQW